MTDGGVAADGTFDFRTTRGFARSYLRTYYSDTPQVDEQLLSRFLTTEAPRLRGSFAEIGCGPTIHHVLPLAPFLREVHMLDYLDDNLEEVRRWTGNAPHAHDWRRFTRLCLFDAGQADDEAAVAAREHLVRQRIVRIAPCNLLVATPAAERHRYDAVGCFYCAEEIGIQPEAWARVVARVTDHIAPGGTLLMSALAGMTSYHVVDEHGRRTELPCARVTAADLRNLLPKLGFPAAATRITTAAIDHPDVGVTAVVMVAAQKSR